MVLYLVYFFKNIYKYIFKIYRKVTELYKLLIFMDLCIYPNYEGAW